MSNVDDHLKGSATRFWQLIEQRTAPGADVAALDRRIWDLFGEEWAVMFTDLSGFSRHVADFGPEDPMSGRTPNRKLRGSAPENGGRSPREKPP